MLLTPVGSWVCSHSAPLEVLGTQLCALTKPKHDNPELSSLSSPASCRNSSSWGHVHLEVTWQVSLELGCLLQRGCWWGSSTALSHPKLSLIQQCCATQRILVSCSCDLLELLNRNTIMSRQKSFGAYSFFWQLFNGWESQGWAQLMPSMDAVHAHLSLMQGSLSLPHAAVPTAQSALTELNTTSLLPWRCVSNLDHVNDSDYRTATLPDGWHGQSRAQAVVGAERSRQAWPCFVISEWCYRGFLKVFTTGWISGNNLSNVFLIGLLKSHLFFLLSLWSRKIPPCSIQRRRRRYWEYVTPLILFDPCRILLPWWTL